MEKITRRKFIGTLGAGVAAMSLGSACSSKQEEEITEIEGTMTYREGPRGDKVSILGYGAMRFPNVVPTDFSSDLDQDTINELVDYALEHGVNYFDTAPVYSRARSETAVGIALSRHPRSSYFVATKLSNFNDPSREASMNMYQNSFKSLQTDHIDYYLLHAIGDDYAGFDRRFVENGMLEFLLKEREAGRIRNLGFSFHGSPAAFEKYVNMHGQYHWDFVQIQMNYQDWNHSDECNASYMYGELVKRKIPVVIMEPLLGGGLSKLPLPLSKALRQRDPERSVASWAFRFVGSYPGVLTVLSGMTYMAHLKDNLKSFSPLVPLTEEEKNFLFDIAYKKKNYDFVPCTTCQYCMPCPYGINIPGIFSHYNSAVIADCVPLKNQEPGYAKARRQFLKSYLKEIEYDRAADHCIGCGTCLSKCPQKIKIPERLRKISDYVEKLRRENW